MDLSEGKPEPGTFWRAEGSLINLSAVRPVAFFAWNAQSFSERWIRRSLMGVLAMARPFLYVIHRVFATRVLHSVLRGISQDRLDLLGEEYFQHFMKPRLKPAGVAKLKELLARDPSVVLVSQALDHVTRPMARYLGVERIIANRLEFRDGLATGRLRDPVIRPRGGLARLTGLKADGRLSPEQLCRSLGFSNCAEALAAAVTPAERDFRAKARPLVLFERGQRVRRTSVRQTLAGRHILLIGVTGFIGKVWLSKILTDLPEVGKIYLLIRPQASSSGVRRFEKIIETSPVFEHFHHQYGSELPRFMAERVEVVEGDVTQPDLGLEPATARRLAQKLDLIINSSGLTDFNPDLRTALAANVEATFHIIEFQRRCDHAGLLHLSTCYVAGARDGRMREQLQPNYTPRNVAGFDAESELRSLAALIRETEARAETPEITESLLREAQKKPAASGGELTEAARKRRVEKLRSGWLRTQMVEAGMRRAKELGFPNTYTFTKSLSESLILKHGGGLPVVVVRPSIVETSTHDPFSGWNEGVNTSAPLSYLLGTYFRQLPSNERKRLDLIPVDLVCRGMLLVAAAIIERRHEPVYQLATSERNPCDMRRSIELTCLAHRKHYLAQQGLEHWLRARFDTIAVSKARYQSLSAPRQKAVIQRLQRVSGPLTVSKTLARKERGLDRVEKLIELYEPFILHNEQVFEAENVEVLSAGLAPGERAAFGYDCQAIDWWEYWINIHIPALRKWSYPLIAGRPVEASAPRAFRMPEGFVTAR